MARIEFKYRQEHSRLFGRISRPVAEVYIQIPKAKWIQLFMYVDSGADISLIPSRLGDALGFKILRADVREIKGIGGKVVPVVIKKVRIRIGGKAFNARIAWSLIEEVPLILGRIDVFNRFKITFEERSRTVTFDG